LGHKDKAEEEEEGPQAEVEIQVEAEQQWARSSSDDIVSGSCKDKAETQQEVECPQLMGLIGLTPF
jgi:hypothetical protein